MMPKPHAPPPAPQWMQELAEQFGFTPCYPGTARAMKPFHADVLAFGRAVAARQAQETIEKPALLTYMEITDGPTRDAAFLRTYAARVRDRTAVLWEIPNTVASTLENIADRIEARQAALAVPPAQTEQT